jgi:hypothetical protein
MAEATFQRFQRTKVSKFQRCKVSENQEHLQFFIGLISAFPHVYKKPLFFRDFRASVAHFVTDQVLQFQ